MQERELGHIVLGIAVLSVVIGFQSILSLSWQTFGAAIFFAFIIIAANITAKKIAASSLDADVEHQIWGFQRYGLKPSNYFNSKIPVGAILPLFMSIISLGIIKFSAIMTYETTAMKRRAAKRFGTYSFTEMTDWHNALIGASGILVTLIISFISYWIPGMQTLSEAAAYYAFFNMIPISKLDGGQIYFGSRVLWTTLAIITAIFTAYAIILV